MAIGDYIEYLNGFNIYYKEGASLPTKKTFVEFRFAYDITYQSGYYRCNEVHLQARTDTPVSTVYSTTANFYITGSNNSKSTSWEVIGNPDNKATVPPASINIKNITTNWKTIGPIAKGFTKTQSANFTGNKNWSAFRVPKLYVYYNNIGLNTSFGQLAYNFETKDVLRGRKITINFDSAGGNTAPASISTLEGNNVSWPGSATHENNNRTFNVNFYANDQGNNKLISKESITVSDTYNFNCWKSNQTGFEWSSGTLKPTMSHDFVAQWNIQKGKGTCVVPSYELSGYKLDGWYTAKSGGTQIAGMSGSTTELADETNLYAHWIADKHEIKVTYAYLDKDNKIQSLQDDKGNEYQTIATSYGSTVTVKLPNIWGWNSPSQLVDESGNTIALNNISGNKDTNYFALYTVKTNTIILNLNKNGAKLDGSTANKTITYNILDGVEDETGTKWIYIMGLYKPTCVLGNTTYCFLGWNTTKDGSGKYIEKINPKDKEQVTSWGSTTTLYAQWLPLGKYVYRTGSGWCPLINSWVYKNNKWQGWIPNIDKSELIKSNTTAWVYKNGKWHKEYGGSRI